MIQNSQKVETIKNLSADEWMNKVWYIHTKEYYEARKRNKLLMYSIIGMDLKNIMLSGRSQMQKK